MDSDLIVGLQIGLIGLSVTFLAMGLVILVMVLLVRLFPDMRAAGREETEAGPIRTEGDDEQALEEMAVALAVGICVLERRGELKRRDPSLGRLLE